MPWNMRFDYPHHYPVQKLQLLLMTLKLSGFLNSTSNHSICSNAIFFPNENSSDRMKAVFLWVNSEICQKKFSAHFTALKSINQFIGNRDRFQKCNFQRKKSDWELQHYCNLVGREVPSYLSSYYYRHIATWFVCMPVAIILQNITSFELLQCSIQLSVLLSKAYKWIGRLINLHVLPSTIARYRKAMKVEQLSL